jgi:hypothetical protein
MATVVFRPELCNPSRDKEVVVSFLDITAKQSEPNTIEFKAGINYNLDDELWAKCKAWDTCKQLMGLGALREEASDLSADTAVVPEASLETTIAGCDLAKALSLIEECHDPAQLDLWHVTENRTRVRNSIMKRRTAILEGNA